MTKEEIKATITMNDVLARYGLKAGRNRKISCPFHDGDRTPSMEIYPDGYYCFGCNTSGDIFKFVQEMEKCDFKKAFLILGGTYKHRSRQEQIALSRKFIREKKEREARIQAEADFKRTLTRTITIVRTAEKVCDPESDMYADAVHILPWILWMWEEKYINGNEIDEAAVLKECTEIEQRFLI